MPRDTPAPATALPAISPRNPGSPGSSGSSGSPSAPVLSPRPAFAKPPALDLGAQMQQPMQQQSVQAAQGAAVGQRAASFSSPRFGEAAASSPRVLVASDHRVPYSVPRLDFSASAPPFAPQGVAAGQAQAQAQPVAVAQPADSILYVPELGGIAPTLVVGPLALLDARTVFEKCVLSKYSGFTDANHELLQTLEGRTLRWDIDGRAFVVRDVAMALCGQSTVNTARWIRNNVKFDKYSSLGEVTAADVSHVPTHFDMTYDFEIATRNSEIKFEV